MTNQLLVVGASGVNGRAVVEHFNKLPDWDVTTLMRSEESPFLGTTHISANLLDRTALQTYQNTLHRFTHIFYAALKPDNDPKQEADENADMLQNLLDVALKGSSHLEHVLFLQGGKVYGAHLGVYKTPAREGDSRHFPPNLYFRHEDLLQTYADKHGFIATALRPDIVIGHSIGSAMNLGNLIGVYGALCMELGVAMQFPGTKRAYEVLVNCTNSHIVAEASDWAFNNAATGAYNITNGDVFRWKHVWPKLCAFFELEEGEPQPISLQERLTAMGTVWQEMVQRYGLEEHNVLDYSQGSFGDFIFRVEEDAIFDTTKARSTGFDGMTVRTDEALLNHLHKMRERKLIP